MLHTVRVGRLELGPARPLFFIAGPCVIESERHSMKVAEFLSKAARALGVPLVFKASYDKA
ncbi:MAG: 3-deoxy-8-phosphooctulonate synthase, partial [Acidobacteria bacterium]